jgi:hypothetical protein
MAPSLRKTSWSIRDLLNATDLYPRNKGTHSEYLSLCLRYPCGFADKTAWANQVGLYGVPGGWVWLPATPKREERENGEK